jgi:Ca2+-binding RTX toxin-like protein
MDTLIGIEHVSGTIFDDTLIGDGGDNWIWGGSNGSGVTGNDTLSGNGGNDLIWVGTGNHTLDGGADSDTLSFFANQTDVTPDGVTVSLLLQGGAQATEQGLMVLNGFENLSGTIYDDSLTGDGSANVLLGDIGNDTISGGLGADTLYGDGRTSVDTHDTGGSDDRHLCRRQPVAPPARLATTRRRRWRRHHRWRRRHRYRRTPHRRRRSISAAASSGAAATTRQHREFPPAPSDFARGTAGANVLAGNDGHDFMRGLAGNDILKGGNQDDYLDGGLGDDVLDGGAGIDRAAYSPSATAGVTVNLNIVGIAQATGQGNDILSGIEHVSGTRFNDLLTGNGGDNWIWGGSDGSGVTGNDILAGNGGNDLVQVGTGNHVASGGSGTDTLSLHGNGTDITPAGGAVSLLLQGAPQATGQGSWNLSGFENLSGSNFNDALTGDNGDNLLAGYSGNDVLSGGKGDDNLLGDGVVVVDTHDTGGSGPIVTIDDVSLAAFPDPAGNDVLDGGKGMTGPTAAAATT